MTQSKILNKIISSKIVADAAGNEYLLDSHIDESKGAFIQAIIQKKGYRHSIEIGCAYGISSLYICDTLKTKKVREHSIIDPYQDSQWHNIGIDNLKRDGINFFHLIKEKSEIALPRLLAHGKQFDFAFIDGWHTFDHFLLDFFYLNRLIKIGGTIVIDDVHLPAIKKAAKYLLNYPCYKLCGGIACQNTTAKKLKKIGVGPLRAAASLVPAKFRLKIFNSSIAGSELDYSMIALEKIADDQRNWDWFKEF